MRSMKSRGFAYGSVGALATLVCSCLLTADLHRLDSETNSPVASSEAGTSIEGGTDDGTGGGCSAEMVTITGVKGASGTFCVDAYEVSVADYRAFVASAPDPATHDQGSLCTWNTTFNPSTTGGCTSYDLAAVNREAPIACIDWCDAHAYCASVGKRLCGNLDASRPTNPLRDGTNGGDGDFATSEWYAACSADGTKLYPYGNDADVAACVDRASGPQARGTTTCEGGYPGLHDMSGNVAEWDNTCQSGAAPEADGCRARGGAFWAANDPPKTDLLRCDSIQGGNRASAYNDRGFRCCKTP